MNLLILIAPRAVPGMRPDVPGPKGAPSRTEAKLEGSQRGECCRAQHGAPTLKGMPVAQGYQAVRRPGTPHPGRAVVDFDRSWQLVKDLTETMLDAPGVGLAAPQIGVSLRVFTYPRGRQRPRPPRHTPSLSSEGEPEEDDEGCLSLPPPRAAVPHPAAAPRAVRRASTCTATPVTLEGTELLARLVQHETDPSTASCHRPARQEQRKLAMKAIREPSVRHAPSPRSSLAATPPNGSHRERASAARFAGTPAAALPTLRALAASRHDVAAVLTRPDAPVGRAENAPRRRWPSSRRSSGSRH